MLYFNRLFATVLSYGIRAYTWHYYRVYVDINALQFSFLGGRVFFKGIRYHGVNETIFIHGGFVTWHYWRRTVRETDLSGIQRQSEDAGNGAGEDSANDDGRSRTPDSVGEQGGVKKTDSLPYRLTAKFYGLEWYIYNRTPAYDSILAGFGLPTHDDSSIGDDGSFSSPSYSKTRSEKNAAEEPLADTINKNPTTSSAAQSATDRRYSLGNILGQIPTAREKDNRPNAARPKQELGLVQRRLLRLLPTKLTCNKGAFVIGNENTRSVLTTTFDSAMGAIEACGTGSLDLYRQIFSFEFGRPAIQMRKNPDFKQNQLATANGLGSMRDNQPSIRRKRDMIFDYRFQKRRIWHSLRDLVPYFQTSVESFHAQKHAGTPPKKQNDPPDEVRWVGLSRYLDETSQDDHDQWSSVEYARFSSLLESPSVTVTYYWDIPGRVESHLDDPSSSIRQHPLDINRASPPEWGIDLKVEGGSINYGPWADRERVGLQNVFFPNSFRSSEPAEPLVPGDSRQSTIFRFRVEINEELTLRIPTREQSKDWQWKGRADTMGGPSRSKKQQRRRQSRNKESDKGHFGPDVRPFGWLSLRVARDSSINYRMDMVASESGYFNQLSLDLRESKLLSSVNHGTLWQCPRQLMTCDLSVPSSWKSRREWGFNIESQNLELFLLRDHIFLLTDLISDWGSGPPADYYTFVPFIYKLNLSFSNFSLFVNVNDQNIISNPVDLDDNRMVVIKGKELTSDVTIPLRKYRPEQNTVTFNLNLHDGGVDFLTPLWDTLHTFLQDKSTATLEHLFIGGSYNYFLSTSSDLTDTLILNVDGVSPKLYLFGFLIKSFMMVKENYFGDEMHFKTLEEFQDMVNNEEQSAAPHGINPNRKSNGMDVIVHVNIESPRAVLPESLYDRSKCLRLDAPSIVIDLRFTNYYMDMLFSLSPLRVSLESHETERSPSISSTQLFIDGTSVHGHRLFGLPPSEPTYICNWDFDVGRVIGECSPEFLTCLIGGLQSFDMSFDNEENTLPRLHPIVLHDVTFLRARIDLVHISLLLGKTAFILSCGPSTTKFNDFADSKFSKRLNLLAPEVKVAAIDRHAADLYTRRSAAKAAPLGLFETTINLKMAQRRGDHDEFRRLQQEHIRIHDRRTQRTPWLLFDSERIPSSSLSVKSNKVIPPTMAIPPMPAPIPKDHHFAALKQSAESRSAASTNSFLVSSDISSLRSTRQRSARNVESPSHPIQEEELSQRLASPPDDEPGARVSSGLRHSGPTTRANDSNSWDMPNFSIHKVELDTTQLPSHPNPDIDHSRDTDPEGDSGPSLSHFEHKTTITNFSCMFPTGVKGFCTPEFLFILSALLEELQPKHPVEVIDSLQKKVISDIVAHKKSMSQPKKSTGFAVRVPFVLFKLANSMEAPNKNRFSYRDEYDIGIYDLKTEFRTKVKRQKDDLVEGIKQSSAVHAAAQSVLLSVEGSRGDRSQEKAIFSCHLGDLNFWLAVTPDVRSHLQIRDFDAVTSTKSLEQLAFLVRRTTTMSDEIITSFQESSSLKKTRLRFLIYALTQSAASIPDPTFLTRISYVLRVAPTHLRQHDSWKIISRIRNVYNNLPSSQQKRLASDCLTSGFSLPRNAKSIVLSGFDQWRAWDLAHVEKSYVMQQVWDVFEAKPKPDQVMVSLSSAVKVFRFSIDPGLKESDYIVEDLSIAVSVAPEKGAEQDAATGPKEVVTLQCHCSSTSLRLRWEILDLVEEVMRTMSTVTLESSPPPQSRRRKSNIQRELQIIMGADLGSVTLDAINIRVALAGRALRASLVHQLSNEERLKHMSLLLSAEACSSELSSFSKTLMFWQFGNPYMYGSCASEVAKTKEKNDWKVAGSCKKLRFDMKEDPLSVAHLAERLIEDEIRSIRHVVDHFNAQPKPTTKPSLGTKTTRNNFYIALFLDDYRLNFSLLPSLAYTISGEVARASLLPTMDSKLEVDFDLKTNSHALLSGEGDKRSTLSVLRIPPINGRVVANVSGSQPEVDADVTIEAIRLEASAVRSLLGALTGAEVSHLVSDLKENVDDLQRRVRNTLVIAQKSPEPKQPGAGNIALFKARLTMAGIGIHAVAPGVNSRNYSADMDFSLGMVRMRLDNGLESGLPMEFPEFHIDASKISFDLKRREKSRSVSYGGFAIDARIVGTSTAREQGETVRVYKLISGAFDIELFAETAALVVDVATHLQEHIRTLDLSQEVKRLKQLRQRGQSESQANVCVPNIQVNDDDIDAQHFLNAIYSLEFKNIQVGWNMATAPSTTSGRLPDDLVFSIKRLDLSNQRKNAAKLRIEDMELQMVPYSTNRKQRSLNSALMPELVFNVAYSKAGKDLRLAFQAAGKSLDLRATSEFMIPARMIRDSIASASQTLREANAVWNMKPATENTESGKSGNLFGNKRLRSVLVDVDFAGAIVSIQGRHRHDQQTMLTATLKGSRLPEEKYGQFVQGDTATTATLRTPGVALKVQFDDNGQDEPALNAELKVDPSTNVLYPTLVTLVKQMTSSIKEAMGGNEQAKASSTTTKMQPQKLMEETPFDTKDPSAILGRCKFNVGLLICKQEFSLSCQPIARVAATARFDSVYVTINTVQSDEYGRFLSLLVAFNSLGASVKHVYSNESTASFDVDSMVMSIMNSKHLRNSKGIAAILKVSPMKMALNAKQVQDFLLFREIWLPSNDDTEQKPHFEPPSSEAQTYIVQRYHQVASASVFPWNSTISFEQVEIQLDLGSTLGKAQFRIDDLWLSSRKTSDREQTLCIGFDNISADSKGRMSGMVKLQTLKVRTSIQWPDETPASGQTPLIQASAAFDRLQAKASFDYQPILVAHIAKFEFLMYNVRGASGTSNQRLFSILEGDTVQVFCTSLTASQCLALIQAWQRLVQDKRMAYGSSLKEMERYLHRKASVAPGKADLHAEHMNRKDSKVEKAPISLQTGVVVKIKTVNIGAFPSSLFDNQIFKLDANHAQARFDVALEEGKIHSALGLTLGELRVALSGTRRPSATDLENLSVDEVASRATEARGGTILKVPQLVARMETWQEPGSSQIAYIFQSTFEGKVDVGWNYSRISFIRDMWESHSRALASRLGKPLAPSAVRITGGPGSSEGDGEKTGEQQEKITAVVNVPQSRYMYTTLEPPVIETPQLRDMGEATPPLEWIGLQRDKLPNVTHQIIIVTLLEVAREVEDAYAKILGAS